MQIDFIIIQKKKSAIKNENCFRKREERHQNSLEIFEHKTIKVYKL